MISRVLHFKLSIRSPSAEAHPEIELSLRNGEMCKVSFFQLTSPTSPYLALGSKNVTLAVTLRSKVEALADLEVYEEERYDFAKEMALVFLEPWRMVTVGDNIWELWVGSKTVYIPMFGNAFSLKETKSKQFPLFFQCI